MSHLKRLLPRHYKILELCLNGKNRKDIAKEVGLTPRTISNITGSPIFQEEYTRLRIQRNKKLDEAAAQELADLRKTLHLTLK